MNNVKKAFKVQKCACNDRKDILCSLHESMMNQKLRDISNKVFRVRNKSQKRLGKSLEDFE